MKLNYNYINNNGEYAPYILTLDDRTIINPTKEQYERAGYVPYTEPELTQTEIEINNLRLDIEALKESLAATDYIALKAVEGYDCDTIYPNWRADRQTLRKEINELEKQINEKETH